MKNKTFQRIKKSRLGRLLCRIVGEDTGAVMMEYVLVAMLIAAATVAAVAYFGRDTQGMLFTENLKRRMPCVQMLQPSLQVITRALRRRERHFQAWTQGLAQRVMCVLLLLVSKI